MPSQLSAILAQADDRKMAQAVRGSPEPAHGKNHPDKGPVDLAPSGLCRMVRDEGNRASFFLDQSQTLILDGHLWSFFAVGDDSVWFAERTTTIRRSNPNSEG